MIEIRDDKIKLLVCGNRGVFDGMLLLALSITEHTKRPITLYIGTMELAELDQRFKGITEEMAKEIDGVLKASCPKSCVKLLDFSNRFREELINSKNIKTGYTPYTMIRLFADEIEGLSGKLLYMDTDVMVRGDISELYDSDISDYHLAGVRDYIGKCFFGPRYLNAGVLLLNLDRMKEDGIFPRARKLCNEKKMLLLDQHALNKFAKRKLILSRRYNEQKSTGKNTLVRHFAKTVKWFPVFHTQNIKPWQIKLVHEKLSDHNFDDIYIKYHTITAKKEVETKAI